MEPVILKINTIKNRGIRESVEAYRQTSQHAIPLLKKCFVECGATLTTFKTGSHRAFDTVIWFAYGEKPKKE